MSGRRGFVPSLLAVSLSALSAAGCMYDVRNWSDCAVDPLACEDDPEIGPRNEACTRSDPLQVVVGHGYKTFEQLGPGDWPPKNYGPQRALGPRRRRLWSPRRSHPSQVGRAGAPVQIRCARVALARVARHGYRLAPPARLRGMGSRVSCFRTPRW